MDSIQFNNFRRFKTFPRLELGDVTLLVGGNNAGKSTLVKAMMTVRDNLEALDAAPSGPLVPRFGFDTKSDLHIGSFYRALNSGARGKGEEKVEFTFEACGVEFSMNVCPLAQPGRQREVSDENTECYLARLRVYDPESRLEFVGTFVNNGSGLMSGMLAAFTLGNSPKNLDLSFLPPAPRIEGETLWIDGKPFSLAGLGVGLPKMLINLSSWDAVDKALKKAETEMMMSSANGVEASFSPCARQGVERLEQLRELLVEVVTKEKGAAQVREKAPGPQVEAGELTYDDATSSALIRTIRAVGGVVARHWDEADKEYAREYRSRVAKFEDSVRRALGDFADYSYVRAHAASQEVMYDASRAQNYTAKIIEEYYRTVQGDRKMSLWVENWLQDRVTGFGLGRGIRVTRYPGSNYIVEVEGYDEGKHTLMSDLGMGAIQVVVLLMQLAVLLKKARGAGRATSYVFLEEPELNLHPNFQSRLADLFLSVSTESGGRIRLVVETHSEYLVRKTQVLTAQAQAKSSSSGQVSRAPFRVYYFPEKEPPYQMRYRPDGKFENEFGKGFFDEASNLAFDLL